MLNPIADYLTRIRNAAKANKRIVEIPASNIKERITKILFETGYILNYKVIKEEGVPQGTIKVALKYDRNGASAIKKIGMISKPGLRKYSKVNDIPRILNGLGVIVISTSKGVMTDKQAKANNIGGELICFVY